MLCLWSRGDSNPGPNRKPICFLHAYPVFNFRAAVRNRHLLPEGICSLSSCFLVCLPERQANQPCFPGASEPGTARQGSGETARPPSDDGKALIYYASIRLRARNWFRHLLVRNQD